MSKTFFLSVKDQSSGKIYTFDAFIEQDGSYYDLYIGDTKGFTRFDACIHIVIGQDDEASLADLSYHPKCEIDGNLLQGIGTTIMLKGALKYVIQAFPHIRRVSLQDVAKKKNMNVLLTPKRLLLEKPGWYEERFGAKPTMKTQAVKRWIKKHQHRDDMGHPAFMISKPSWGSMEDLQDLSHDYVKLLGTTWDIVKSTIDEYPVTIQILETKQTGGGSAWINSVKRKMRRHSSVLGQIALLTQRHAGSMEKLKEREERGLRD